MADQQLCVAKGPWGDNPCGLLRDAYVHTLDRINDVDGVLHDFVAPLPTTHDLKIWPEYFAAIKNRTKLFEVRENDRLFMLGDQLTLREWDPNDAAIGYTGAFMNMRVVSIFHDVPGLKDGYVAMGIEVIE